MNRFKSLKIVLFIGTVLPFFVVLIGTCLGLNRFSVLDSRVEKINEEIQPSLLELQKLKNLIFEFQLLTSKQNTKEVLNRQITKIQEQKYPELKLSITKLFNNHSVLNSNIKLEKIFARFESIQSGTLNRISKLTQDKEQVESFARHSELSHHYERLVENLDLVYATKFSELKENEASINKDFVEIRYIIFIFLFIVFLIDIITLVFRYRLIMRTYSYFRTVLQKLNIGSTSGYPSFDSNLEEFNELSNLLISLINNLKKISLFAENIGKGNYDVKYQPRGKEDALGNSLLGMQNSLVKVSVEDSKRNWVTEGHANFSEILRSNTNNIENLSNEILSKIVKYMGANQGAFYVINETSTSNKFMDMKACYAWGRTKFKEGKIYEGEGLAGQAWIEKELLYITDVPDNYVSITSGLGEANPNALLIAPLIVNDEVFGLIEIASFHEIEKHQIEFIEKLSESIASTISNAKVNQRTQNLLGESQEMTEQMMAQEEEMRQNMEELQATQDEMERVSNKKNRWEALVERGAILFEFNQDLKLTTYNGTHLEEKGYTAEDIRNLKVVDLIDENNIENIIFGLETDRDKTFFWRIKNKDQSVGLYKVSISRGICSDSKQVEYYLFATDVTTANVAV